ncbi:uncharacterized protein LOC118826977 isoform X1 [Colossoma macropomum]|uniref:uncharacterized protein LOC118826977 isoform X1 n=2 Tax=Colossoma macropomum TaxID=42526 RepID=UPI00186504EB|nr:uncharacterized protein LOC118826977 isoform X1 [Colossoma macropomum]XP_036454012.1 uncharacterized protein LOC118826977 isoform X2 [Colossoma macropomum]XP_036454013.1 uncharacterized protein LOC118826977 isoform X1 [Colossoma macropomum]
MSVMPSCSSALCFLILLTTTFTSVSVSADLPVKVKLHDSATLPCYERCSGLARWTVFHKRSDTLAECDQTSCRSVKEGYQMIRDQYLKGNLSLIITEADFSKRGWYTCDCASKDVCDVHLQIEPLNTTVEIMAGESLILRLDVSDAVEVIYNSTGTPGPSSGQICTVDGPSLQCKPEYTQRSSLTSGLELRRMTPSESGVYIIMDSRNKEVIHTYTVTVQDVQQSSIWKDGYQKGNSDGYQKGSEDGYRNGLGIGAVVFGIMALALGVILGMFGGPRVRPLMGRCVQRFRREDSSDRRRDDPSGGLQAEDVESGVALARAAQPELESQI